MEHSNRTIETLVHPRGGFVVRVRGRDAQDEVHVFEWLVEGSQEAREVRSQIDLHLCDGAIRDAVELVDLPWSAHRVEGPSAEAGHGAHDEESHESGASSNAGSGVRARRGAVIPTPVAVPRLRRVR